MVVNSNTMNGKKILGGTRNMQNFSKMNLFVRGFNDGMTNMADFNTFSTGDVNVVLATVFFPHGYFL